jgi:hypothetical protein
VQIGALDLTRHQEDLTIALALEGPSTASATSHSSSLTAGATVGVWRGGVSVGVPLFAGTLLQATPSAARFAERVQTAWTATSYRWRLSKEATVTTRLQGIGVNMAVRQLVATYAPAGFSCGYLPSTLGNIDEMQFTDETLTRALDRIAAQVSGGAYWDVDAWQRVSMWLASEDPPHLKSGTIAVTDASTHRTPQVEIDLASIRTRVLCEGGGSGTTAVTAAGATTVAVEETGWYGSSGGGARAGQTVFAYTGRSSASGPGTLTGCTGITADIPQGELVQVREQADDASAQTALAALIGGTGIAVHVVRDGRINAGTAAARAAADLRFYSDVIRGLTFTADEDVQMVPGRFVATSITRPAVIADNLRIQQVTIQQFGAVTSTATSLERTVETRPVEVSLAHLLRGEG